MLPRMISPPILPQDITSLILEQFLFDDTPTLQTCALVARSFLISSQKVLFHTIHLSGKKAQQRCQKLHPILLDNPILLTYVRELFVSSAGILVWTHWICTEKTLHAILNMLPHLRLLSIQFPGLEWNGLPAEFKKALERVFTLPSLVVCKVKGMYNFPTEFFRALKHLKELSLEITSVTVEPDMICATTNLKKIQSLQCLTLTGARVDASATLEAMRITIDMSHLREVFVHSWALRWVWEATKDSADSLNVLEWRCFGRRLRSFFDAGEMDMTAFKALRVLHLATELSDLAIRMIMWLVRSLESMSRANNLEEITICLEMYGGLDDSVSASDVLVQAARYLWDFNTVLTASGNFSKLDRLVLYICIDDEVYNQEIQALLQSHLPGLSTGTHGILHVIPTILTLDELLITTPPQATMI